MTLLNAWAKTQGFTDYSAWQDHCKANDTLAAMGKAQKIDPSVTTEAEAIAVLEGFVGKQAQKVSRDKAEQEAKAAKEAERIEREAHAAAEAGAKDRT